MFKVLEQKKPIKLRYENIKEILGPIKQSKRISYLHLKVITNYLKRG
jgi:hypothetical protein